MTEFEKVQYRHDEYKMLLDSEDATNAIMMLFFCLSSIRGVVIYCENPKEYLRSLKALDIYIKQKKRN